MSDENIHEIMTLLQEASRSWCSPAVTVVAERHHNPFTVLVSCILSLRTQDRVTATASERLFALATEPCAMMDLSQEAIERAIFPVGFYRTKTVQLIEISRDICLNYSGKVPDDIDSLLRFKGVGRKTANLVVTLGFGKPGICVDTHVHRISNRLGYVSTKTVEETEYALRSKLPLEFWLVINDYLVSFGQNVCLPVSPRCSICPLVHLCERKGVSKSR